MYGTRLTVVYALPVAWPGDRRDNLGCNIINKVELKLLIDY